MEKSKFKKLNKKNTGFTIKEVQKNFSEEIKPVKFKKIISKRILTNKI